MTCLYCGGKNSENQIVTRIKTMKCSICNVNEAESGRKQCSKCRKAIQRGQNVPSGNVPSKMSPADLSPAVLPANYGQDNCGCMHCKQLKVINPKAKLNHSGYMTAAELEANGFDVNRVSLPGDIDYSGCAAARSI